MVEFAPIQTSFPIIILALFSNGLRSSVSRNILALLCELFGANTTPGPIEQLSPISSKHSPLLGSSTFVLMIMSLFIVCMFMNYEVKISKIIKRNELLEERAKAQMEKLKQSFDPSSLEHLEYEEDNDPVMEILNGGERAKPVPIFERVKQFIPTLDLPTWEKIYNENRPFVDLLKKYITYQKGAEKRELAFTLSPYEFLTIVKQSCYYCGAPGYNGVDRHDNSIGYIFTNCKPCCSQCNFAKRTLTEEKFVEWLLRAAYFQAKKRAT
jgi:hypothetical protein